MKIIKKLLSLVLCIGIVFSNFTYFVSGETADVVVSYDNLRSFPENYGKNLLANKLPIFMDYYYVDRGNPVRTFVADSTDNCNITNGDFSDSWHVTKQVFADYNGGNPIIYSNGETTCKFTFKLDKVTDLSAICMINHPTRAYMAEKYEIYASNEYRKLFWQESKVAYVNNPDSRDRQLITLDKKGVVYVGINVIFPCQIGAESEITLNAENNYYYPRFSEFGVFGTEGEEASFPTLTNLSNKTVAKDELLGEETIDLSKSFLKGVLSQVYVRGIDDSEAIDQTNTVPTNANLTDGNLVTDWQGYVQKFAKLENGLKKPVDNDNHYIDIVLDAGSEKELRLFYLRNHSRMALRTARYKIFASNKPYSTNSYGVATNSNMIADCYNNTGAQDNYFLVPEDKTIKARYYCIRIYDSCFDYGEKVFENCSITADGFVSTAYTRLCEVAAFTAEDLDPTFNFNSYASYGNAIGAVKHGTRVKSVLSEFSGKGTVYVTDKNSAVKAPNALLSAGDIIRINTDYGKSIIGEIAMYGDANSSGTLTVSDLVVIRNALLNGKKGMAAAAGDTDCNGSLEVTDVVRIIDTMVGGVTPVEDAAPVIIKPQKYGVKSEKRSVSVDTETVVTDNFLGFGTNSFSSTLTAEGMAALGYNKVYHELAKKRIASMKPSVSRMWFQVDWMVTNTLGDDGYLGYKDNPSHDPDYVNYKNGIYDFESEEMQAFYEYIEMLNDYGCEIEINFGWKTGTRIQYWFNTPCSGYKSGAPKDLPAFARAAAALVKHLVQVKGYDFIKSITFYNEPNTGGDFENDAEGDMDEKIYWSSLVREVDTAFKKNGMRNKIEIWGPEVAAMENATTKEWFDYQLKNSASYVDMWTGHKYYHSDLFKNNYSEAFDTFCHYVEATNNNIMVTEMYPAITDHQIKQWCSWNDSFASYFIAASNTGIKGVLTWTIMGGYLTDPSNMDLSSDKTSGWQLPRSEETADKVNRIFYEESMFANYIPRGSKVLYTNWMGEDIRASAYLLPDGNITVVVENNGINTDAVFNHGEGEEKEITISFSDGIDRTFRRISYIADSQVINANATVNRPDKTITTVGGKLTDTLGSHYSTHIYTTAKPIKQIEMDSVILHTKPTESVAVKGIMLDCAPGDEIVYTVSEYKGAAPGTITADGIYTPAENAKKGNMVAVRASLKSDPGVFAVSIIYID